MLVVLRPEGADWLNPGIATFVSIGWSQPLPLEDGIILTGAPTPTVRLVVLPQVVVGAEYLVGWHFTRISQLHSTCFYDGIAGRTTVGGSVRRPTKSTTSSAWPQPPPNSPGIVAQGHVLSPSQLGSRFVTGSGRRVAQIGSPSSGRPRLNLRRYLGNAGMAGP